jgi:Tol biopolymer transport system component
VAALVGESDQSGILVSLPDVPAESYSEADGSYSFSCVPIGQYSLRFAKSVFEDEIEIIQTYAGGNAQILDTAYYPLLDMEISRGDRLQSVFTSSGAYSIAADGEAVAFYAADDGGKLFLVTLSDQQSQVIDTGAGLQSFVFSPDGQWLYWLTSSGTLKMQEITADSSTTLQTHVNQLPVFSSNGDYLAFGTSTHAYLAPVGSSSVRDLGTRSTNCESHLQPLFAANGTLIWKASTSGSSCLPKSLHLTPSEGGSDLVFSAVARYALSDDGQLLTFNDGYCQGPSHGCGEEDNGTEYVLQLGESEPVEVGPGSATSWLGAEVFSPDNSRILYGANGAIPSVRSSLILAETDGGGWRQLSSNFCSGFRFSPDSQFALYGEPGTVTCDLFKTPVAGGSPTAIGTNVARNIWGVACGEFSAGSWLASGDSVVFIDGLSDANGTGTLKAVGLSTGTVTTIASDVNPRVCLSPDGGYLLFGLGTEIPLTSLYFSSVTAPEPTLVGTMGWFGTFSPDGTKVLFHTDCEGTTCTLKVLNLDSSTTLTLASNVASNSSSGGAKWAPNNEAVAFVTDGTVLGNGNSHGTLNFAPATGGALTTVATQAELMGWTDSNAFLGRRTGVSAPFSFQNGLYLFPVP